MKIQFNLAMIYASVGGVHIDVGNTKAGISYYRKAIDILNNPKILKDENDTVKLAITFENLGYTYLTIDKPDSALIYLTNLGYYSRRLMGNWCGL